MKLKLRSRVKFFAALFSGVGTAVRKDGLAAYVDLDYSKFTILSSYDPSAEIVLMQSTIDGSFALATVAQIISSSQTQQIISGSTSTVNVSANDGLIALKNTGVATTINLPASATKVGPVKISDWKGDAGTNNITINVIGSDVLPGNLTSWTIAADGASLVFSPLNDGTGYAV